MTAELSKTLSTNNFYHEDYYLWLEKTAKILQQSNFEELDIPNLIEEIQSMGRKEKRSVYSNLKILLMHLLKYRYQPEKRSNSWRYSIEEHRQRIQETVEDSPSLKGYLQESFDKCYQNAKKLAAKETGLNIDAFPLSSPFTLEETLNNEYLPD